MIQVKRVIGSRAAIDATFDGSDGIDGHGYEVVEDLLLNAARRAAQDRYDDAVGRLYRSLELLVQIRLLKRYGIQTGDVDVQKLPDDIRAKYETDPTVRSRDGKIQLASTRSYVLLSEIPDDPLGQRYVEHASRIQNALKIRNYSLFAHGFQPISKANYQEFSEVVKGFIEGAIAAIVPVKQQVQAVQFPKSLNL